MNINYFLPYTAKITAVERILLVLLFVIAGFLRLFQLDEVPPGIHNDEIINTQIADKLYAGMQPSVFYEAGEGREGLYHLLLVTSRSLTSQIPYWYRLPSVVCSMLLILLVYILSRRWFGPWVALVTVGGVSVSFWPVHLGREALRAGTFPLMSVGMAIAFWRGLEQSTPVSQAPSYMGIRWFALAGIFLGLTQYTYLASRVIPLFIGLFIIYLAVLYRTRLFSHWQGLLVFLLIATFIATPMMIYIVRHWGQQARLTQLQEPLQMLLAGNWRPVSSSALATLGMFVWRGDPQSHYNLPGRPVFEMFSSGLFLVGFLIALFDLRHPAKAFCVLWTIMMLIPGMLSQPAPHFIRTSGALVTSFIFPGLAVDWLVTRLVNKWQRIGLVGCLGVLLLVNFGLTLRDYFYRWADLAEVRSFRHANLAETTRYFDQVPDSTPVAACTFFLNEQHFFWRTERQALPYLLNRRDLKIGWYDCLESQLFPHGGQESRYFFQNEAVFAPFLPQAWVDQASPLAEFSQSRVVTLSVTDELAGWIFEFHQPNLTSPVFDETMQFLGFQPSTESFVPGSTLTILTAWRVLATPSPDLSIFLHLYNSSGDLLTQGDALTALSDTFYPEDVFVQRHFIVLPVDTIPGEYKLVTGLYIRGGNRLLLDFGESDSLTLQFIEIYQDAY